MEEQNRLNCQYDAIPERSADESSVKRSGPTRPCLFCTRNESFDGCRTELEEIRTDPSSLLVPSYISPLYLALSETLGVFIALVGLNMSVYCYLIILSSSCEEFLTEVIANCRIELSLSSSWEELLPTAVSSAVSVIVAWISFLSSVLIRSSMI